MNRLILGSILTLLLSTSLQAQEVERYQVSGPDLSGQARIEKQGWRDGLQAVKVSLRFKVQDGKGETRTVIANRPGVRSSDGTVTWSYSVHEQERYWRGMKDWLLGPGWNTHKTRWINRVVEVTLRPAGKGRLTGSVDGLAMTWTRVGRTDDLIVLAVPGLSTNSWNRVGVPYLDENLRALKARGLQGYRVAIKTEASVLTNALFLAGKIRGEAARGRRVIVMAHSKGATDTTAALALYPDLRRHVAGVIAIQPVYGGSPIADYVANNKALTGAVKIAFEKIFKGEKEAVLDLTRASREAFVAQHPYPADEIPTVVITSTFDRKVSKSILYANQKLIKLVEKRPSDGMVMPEHQVIPGAAATIELDDLDHFEPGVRGESPHSPTKITNAALDALLPLLKKRVRVRTGQVDLELGRD